MLDVLKAKSTPALYNLNRAVQYAAEKLIERCFEREVEIRITWGFRTAAQQQDMYNQGRTAASKSKGEKVVTNAKAGRSNHNYGLAIDFVLTKGGYDMKADNDHDGIADWIEVVTQAKLLGFAWGGDWKSFKDYPHFEIMFGLNIDQLQAGKRPTAVQEQAVIDNIKALEAAESMNNVTELEVKVKEQNEALQALEKRTTTLERLVNVSGNQTPPTWSHKALEAAKVVGAITTTNDKSQAELITIQILANMGLFDPGIKKLIDLNKESDCK
ncbi:M15 family metallopeptidase [Paenibacillus dokdonensis]|uniref:M15 family metallopeptidase n=1 Tax=Paenibacillus dokdonensis TaxID=2567944 RepID=A0ABU6GWJ9_9BACL|nr:M15 family metallopeptidase [Paenibacillus dokdonensis]MEC0242756.1 M15 family metallopeptidase [Paenibacillus dokdonensis]